MCYVRDENTMGYVCINGLYVSKKWKNIDIVLSIFYCVLS